MAADPTKRSRVINDGIQIAGSFAILDDEDNVISRHPWHIKMSSLMSDADVAAARQQILETKANLERGNVSPPAAAKPQPPGG